MTDISNLLAVAVNGVPLSAGPFSAITSVSVTDNSGFDSDSCNILIANSGLVQLFPLPQPGAEIAIWMGGLSVGLFVADNVQESGPPRAISITGQAKATGTTDTGTAPITQQKTRSWPSDMTLGDIVDVIAGENGLEPGATESAAAIAPGHLDQVDESDIALLTRVAAQHDLIAKPSGGVLFVGRKGEGITASGATVPLVPITSSMVSRWSVDRSLSDGAGSVVATYRDLDAASDIEVKAGDGEPVRRLRERFKDEATAQAAADAELNRSKRMKETLSMTLPGNPLVAADGRVLVAGLSLAALGEWIVKSVTHSVSSSGFTTSFSAERPPD
ncbi:phage late control D family protein [Aliiroseovarius zhejiangensis]|uniref:phage late control D family protein n=1 Tax=Aliiroseovarius zhejiangensis TaxID=1632025 RepID=UPI00174DA892|nr:contractile injection system protein, VgrG/Pvc8 family [Aliiroseovarius zhejiangensis]